MSYVHMNFPGFTKKVLCTTYDFLRILALISGAIFVENFLLANLKLYIFCTFSYKDYSKKKKNTFSKFKETKCCMCT